MIERKDVLDDGINDFLKMNQMQVAMTSSNLDDKELKIEYDARIKERGLNIRTFFHEGKLYVSKY